MASCAAAALLATTPALAHPLEIVPSDDRIYQDLARLTAQGLTPLWATSARPLTRLEVARLVAAALDRLAALPPVAAGDLEILERLVLTFSDELPLVGYRVIEPPQGFSAKAITGWGFQFKRAAVARVESGTAPWFETSTGSGFRFEVTSTMGFGPTLAVSSRVQQPVAPQFTFPVVDRLYLSTTSDPLRAQVGTMTHWWGPGDRGAFLLSDNAGAIESIRVSAEWPRLRLVKLLAPLSVSSQRYLYAMRADWLATDTLRLGFGEAMVASGDVYLPYVFAPVPLVNYLLGLWVRQQQQGFPDSYNAAMDFDWRIGGGSMLYGEVYADKLASGAYSFPSTGGAAAGLFFGSVLGDPRNDLRLEHSRATNWIYATPGGTNNYVRGGKAMGHWCAPDCEFYSAELSRRLDSRATLRTGYDLVRKGAGQLGQVWLNPTDAWTNLYLSGVIETTQAWHLRYSWDPGTDFRYDVGTTWSFVSNAGHVTGQTQQNVFFWWEGRYEW
ncbi:MAG TPA: capsule assembly Wzi family protein [bacterium]|nr:capsule assembly Wzi family protein [bacterium]